MREKDQADMADRQGQILHRFDDFSRATRQIWAKSGENGGHGLLPHLLDVAAVAEQILRREPPSTLKWAARMFGCPPSGLIRWLAWLVGQHDFGKATIGFQAKWPDGKIADETAGLPFPTRLLTADKHDLSSAVLLPARLPKLLCGAVAAHHGFHFASIQVSNARLVGEPAAWSEARRVIAQAYDDTLQPWTGSPVPDPALSAINWLAGLTSVSDWIGSNVAWFPLGERDETCAGHHARALELANQALNAIGWPPAGPLLTDQQIGVADLMVRMTGIAGIQPRPLQVAADELLQTCTESALLIVEAPMGEGKTELAFLAHLRLQAQLGHRGMYIGLPTQATGNAMFDRTLKFLRSFHADQPLDLQLAHGAAALDDRLVELRGVHGSGAGPGDAVQCSEWFTQKRRALISPYGVGTIDQALYATLNVKHHFVRLWGLTNRVVVLDEVHAYDSYTGGLIESLLRWLKALGCSVILMSATLPASRRRALLSAWDIAEQALPDLPYPRVLLASQGQINGRHCPSRPLAPIELSGMDEELDSIAALTLAQLAGDGCIAVIVNTVDRAQQLYLKLRSQLDAEVPVLLFHARFPAEERTRHEREVLRLFGKTGERPRRALLIATQVAEQSLDIDFDLLISDLAPVDLLLQRAGRLHRHERERPVAHRLPRLIVAGLLAAALPDLKRTGWASVYDTYVLGRTWAFASREERWTLPQDIDRLVQLVYGDEDLPASIDGMSRDYIEVEAWGEHRAEEQQMSQFAANAAIDALAEPQNAYAGKPHGREAGEGLGADNRTRFGAESLTLIPVHVDGGIWRLHTEDAPFDPAIKPDAALSRRLLNRQLKLSRKAVIKALQGADVPPGWAEHPWLRDLRVLPLTDGCWRHGSLRVQLDPDLGVVYSTERTKDAGEPIGSSHEPVRP